MQLARLSRSSRCRAASKLKVVAPPGSFGMAPGASSHWPATREMKMSPATVCMPAGSVSLKNRSFWLLTPVLLVIVIHMNTLAFTCASVTGVHVEAPGVAAGRLLQKRLLMPSAPTVSTSEPPVVAVGVWSEVIAVTVFVYAPGVLLVTSMRTVQLEFAGMLVEAKLMGSRLPAALALGIVPVQVPRPPPMKVCAALFSRFVGRLSVKRTSVSATALGLVSVKVTTVVPPEAMAGDAKLLVMTGGATTRR